ncbi:MAG: GNAT family N-acetyltransferase [Alphaproteobacteria bacterium]|nr:GNAT family N-acetyltransferase [Alphaproteobacteria bacterium]
MSTTIRRATITDAAETAEVFLAARATMTYLPRLHSDDETREFISQVVRNCETFVAIRNNRTVGFAALREGWLDHLYVHPSRHNHGTGSQLFAEVQFQRPEGIQFWVFQQNAGARRFYERHGCALARLTDGSGNEEKLPDALYVWPATRRPEP